MADKRKADYQRLYELAARKVDKQHSDRRSEYRADRAAGRTPKLNENVHTNATKEYNKLATAYENKNKLYAAPGEGVRAEVLKENNSKQLKAKRKITGRIVGRKN
jgi:hypothetical protein